MAAETDTLRRTPLHDGNVAAGARLVPFAGWEMPVQYAAGIRAEHAAVRERAGVFDVSHMGQIETRGPGAGALLQRLVTNDVARIAEGGAQYALLCNEEGGVLDDLFTYRLGPDRYLTVTNAANHARDLAWFEAGLGARDTLRTEACFHLYGNDLSEDRGPIEAGLGWACKEATGFIGAERVARDRAQGTAERLVPFPVTGRGIARHGNPVLGGGVVTPGTLSPTLGYAIGLAYLPVERTAPGTAFEIDVRGKTRTAEVRTKPLIPEVR